MISLFDILPTELWKLIFEEWLRNKVEIISNRNDFDSLRNFDVASCNRGLRLMLLSLDGFPRHYDLSMVKDIEKFIRWCNHRNIKIDQMAKLDQMGKTYDFKHLFYQPATSHLRVLDFKLTKYVNFCELCKMFPLLKKLSIRATFIKISHTDVCLLLKQNTTSCLQTLSELQLTDSRFITDEYTEQEVLTQVENVEDDSRLWLLFFTLIGSSCPSLRKVAFSYLEGTLLAQLLQFVPGLTKLAFTVAFRLRKHETHLVENMENISLKELCLTRTSWKNIKTLLSKFPNLTTLTISMSKFPPILYTVQEQVPICWSHLRELTISFVTDVSNELFHLLYQHCQALRVLKFEEEISVSEEEEEDAMIDDEIFGRLLVELKELEEISWDCGGIFNKKCIEALCDNYLKGIKEKIRKPLKSFSIWGASLNVLTPEVCAFIIDQMIAEHIIISVGYTCNRSDQCVLPIMRQLLRYNALLSEGDMCEVNNRLMTMFSCLSEDDKDTVDIEEEEKELDAEDIVSIWIELHDWNAIQCGNRKHYVMYWDGTLFVKENLEKLKPMENDGTVMSVVLKPYPPCH